MCNSFPQEKLQNAEDAGASEVRFVLDPHSYSREKIMPPITGKNDLARMQVTNIANIESSNDFSFPFFCLSQGSIPGWVSLCVQQCRVHEGRLGWDTQHWVQSEEREGGQSWKIWHRLQLSLPLDRYPLWFFNFCFDYQSYFERWTNTFHLSRSLEMFLKWSIF